MTNRNISIPADGSPPAGEPSALADGVAVPGPEDGSGARFARRHFVQVAGAGAAALLLAACSKGGTGDASGSSGTSGGSGTSGSAAGATSSGASGSAPGSTAGASGTYRSAAFPGSPPAAGDPMALSTGGTVPAAPGYALPLGSSGPSTVSIAVMDNLYAPRSYAQGLPVWNEIQKRTGVTIKWDVTPAQQYAAAMSPRLGSGSGLPDFMGLPGGWDPVKAATQKLAVPLDEYITESNTPNIASFFKAFPDIRKLLTAPDGKLYALSSIVSDAATANPVGLLIRQDWLTKLKLTAPTTLDEWYTVLSAFKTGNPSGAGKGSELPFIGSQGVQSLRPFGNAYGLHLMYSKGWYVDDSGKVIYELMDPRYRDLLVWFNKLYANHLLDPTYYTNDATATLQKVTKNLVGGTGDFSSQAIQYDDVQSKAGVADVAWTMVPPPTSKYITQPYYEAYGPIAGYFIVTKDCKDPKALMRWLDYVWASDEGNTLVTYGLEGVTYTVGQDKRLTFTKWVSDNPQGLDPTSALRYYGAYPTMPWIAASQGPLSEFPWDLDRTNSKWIAISSAIAKYVVPSFPAILPSAQETTETGQIATDVGTFLAESEVKFVLGQEPLTDAGWNKFISTLNGMGVSKLVTAKQQQWDRYSKGQ